MAVTVAQAAIALRLIVDPLGPVPDAYSDVLDRLLDTASAMVEQRAPAAPEAVQDEAIIRITGYLFDMPESPRGDGFAAVMRNSGAAGLLTRWETRRLGGADA